MQNAIQYLSLTYANAAIHAAQMAVDTSLNERTLDVDTMNATVESPAALTTFQQNSPVRFLRNGSQYALWFLSSITRVGPKAYALSMISSLGRLAQMPHRGGIYNGVAASVIIADIMGNVPYYVSPVFSSTLLYGWLPYVAPSGEDGAQTGSAKDNLLQVLFALNATVRDDANGVLRIENLDTAVASTLGADRIYRENASVRQEAIVTAVTVLEHQYIAGGEVTTLFQGTATAGQVVVFDEPMSNLSASGFGITASGANYAVLSAGTGTLTGMKYIHTTREITRSVASAAISNVMRVEDATLVSVTNSGDCARRLADYYSHRKYINVDAVIEFEDAGDVVNIFDPFDKVLRSACIEKISPLDVSQVMKGAVSALVGFTPWQVIPFQDVHEVITSGASWTAPANIEPGTEVTAVLIGGGDGAYGGANGTAGSGVSRSGTISGSTTISVPPGSAGTGGAAGSGGLGGKIFRIAITVNPGSVVSLSIGAGGAVNGGSGGDTTFAGYSSAGGSRSDGGYVDPVTGTVYGKRGADGVKGGDGGKGGSGSENAQTSGYDGGSASSWSGGYGGSGYYTTHISGWLADAWQKGGGGGGGGAAYGSHGSSATGTNGRNGGNGANASAPSAPANYGDGGNGGHGGGGGGAGGGYWVKVYVYPEESWSGSYDWSSTRGTGGAASAGTAGMQGCIHLYYRRPLTA